MEFIIISIFPQIFECYFSLSLPKKAIEKGVVRYFLINPRNYSEDKHKKVDDYTYGGGPGMLLMFPPLKKSIDRAKEISKETHIILLSPSGIKFNQKLAKELSCYKSLTFLCGHYEGVDERIKNYVDEEISIGDFITSGGEIPTLIIIDTILRIIPNFLKREDTKLIESFENGLLEYPQYTRPREYENLNVPQILLSGNHKEIEKFRKKESLKRTLLLRPDLLLTKTFTEEEKKLLKEIFNEILSFYNKLNIE
ncbi:MAG: tRNA (guanosine(37)-N1)-methyltransferase TrmD [Caldisericia bacterium]|nr:tRNA (guanosine(37)-N1)-methyltransferase TrmD [Caldisericia bacterium]